MAAAPVISSDIRLTAPPQLQLEVVPEVAHVAHGVFRGPVVQNVALSMAEQEDDDDPGSSGGTLCFCIWERTCCNSRRGHRVFLGRNHTR